MLPVYAFKDGLCSLEKAVEINERWPDRFISYCGIDPMLGSEAMEEMERQVEALSPVGLKLYPNSWATEEIRGWKMDDPEIAYPFFERAQQLAATASFPAPAESASIRSASPAPARSSCRRRARAERRSEALRSPPARPTTRDILLHSCCLPFHP